MSTVPCGRHVDRISILYSVGMARQEQTGQACPHPAAGSTSDRVPRSGCRGADEQAGPLPRWAAVGLVGTPFLWLGMIGAISFVEAPLKFQAPGITVALGLGIGRLVFLALNGLELLAAAGTTWLMCRARPVPRVVWGPLAGLWTVLALQIAGLRPVLDARAELIITGATVPPAPWHALYIALEVIKVGLLLMLGTAATNFAFDRVRPVSSGAEQAAAAAEVSTTAPRPTQPTTGGGGVATSAAEGDRRSTWTGDKGVHDGRSDGSRRRT